jgi:hypothetical protein
MDGMRGSVTLEDISPQKPVVIAHDGLEDRPLRVVRQRRLDLGGGAAGVEREEDVVLLGEELVTHVRQCLQYVLFKSENDRVPGNERSSR